MTLIGLVADPHIGNHRQHGGPMIAGINTRCRMVLDVLQRAMDTARKAGCDEFHVEGDLFDHDDPSPQIIAAVQDMSEIDRNGMLTVYMLGNHDMTSMVEGDHALRPLQDHGQIYDTPTIRGYGETEMVIIPFQPGPADEWLPVEMAKLLGKDPAGSDTPADTGATRRILALHLGIIDEDTPPFLTGSHDAIHVDELDALCGKYGIRRVFTGNWHDHHNWETGSDDKPVDIHQLGTLCPTGWDNPGLDKYGKLAIYDTVLDTLEFVEIPGPRFLKSLPIDGPTSDDWAETLELLGISKTAGNSTYLRIRTSPAFVKIYIEELDRLKTVGLVVDGKVLIEEESIILAAKSAAKAAKGGDSLAESIVGYISNMPLDEGVDRDNVTRRCLEYMGGSDA